MALQMERLCTFVSLVMVLPEEHYISGAFPTLSGIILLNLLKLNR